MKKRILSLLLAALMVISLAPAAVAAGSFTDVPETHWAYDYVEQVYREGLMNGTSSTTFSPDMTLTRGMFVTILARFAKAEVNNDQEVAFTDVPAGQYYTGAVAWAVTNEITMGTGENTFSPNQAVTRQEMAVFLNRTMKFLGCKCAQTGDLAAFADGTKVASYAVEAMLWAVGAELMMGNDGELCPADNATRAEVAVLMSRVLSYSEDDGEEQPGEDEPVAPAPGGSSGGSIIVTPEPPAEYTAVFHVTPADAAIELKDGEGTAVEPNEDGSFTVKNGGEYVWTVSAEGYVSESGSFTADHNMSITVSLKAKPADPEPAKTVKITFVGENGYAKYNGTRVTEIEVSTDVSFVEFGIYGEYDNGYETDTVTASSGKLSRAGDVCILSDFDEDVTINFTTRFRTLYITYSIKNYNNSWIVTPQAVTWGQKADLPTILRTGYHVDAWYTDEAQTQEYNFDSIVTEDMTLYGDWTIDTYTITFMVDGAVYATAPAKYGGRIQTADMPANPTKDNYIFDGWFFDEECTEPFNNPQFYGDDTLYAKWAEAKLNYVYLDGKNGSDDNTGMTASDAVKTFDKAKELLADAAYKEIRICGQVQIKTAQTWDLSEYPGAMVIRDESMTSGYMVWLDGGDLTLSNIIIDGGGKRWPENPGYMALYVKNATLTLDSGAELCNHVNTSSAGVIFGYQGGKIVMNDGASIHDNQGKYVGAIDLGYGCTMVMYGGEIYNNTAVYEKGTSATSSSTPAGVMRINGSSSYANCSFTMNGGKIYNNSVANTGSTYGNGVFTVYNRGNVTINSGEITGNTGIHAGLLTSVGTKASGKSTENCITINGGKIEGNTARSSDHQIEVRAYSNLVLNGSSFDGKIWMYTYNANRRPVQLTAALTKALELEVESVVYGETLVSGTDDYALTESDLAFVKDGLVNTLVEQYKLVLDTENNVIKVDAAQNIGMQIWLSPTGDDANDGLTKDTAVATFDRAKALLAANASESGDNVITMSAATGGSSAKCFVVNEDQTWSLAGIPNAYIQAEANATTAGYLVQVLDGATLTLENIVIDGNCYYQVNNKNITAIRFDATSDDSGRVSRPSLILNSGAVLRNFNDNAVYAYGGYLEINEGAAITGCTKDYAIWATGSVSTTDGSDKSTTIVINGGTFSSNAYRVFNLLGDTKLTINNGLFENNAAGTGNPGGAVIYANSKNTRTVINGGTFRGNTVSGTSANSLGSVFYTTSACRLTINGGTFADNVCIKEPNAVIAINASSAANLAVVTVGPGANLTGTPFYYKTADNAGALQITGAVSGAVSLTYGAAPADGMVVAQGADYTLTDADLAKFTCTNEGAALVLDTENNQIVVKLAESES